MRSNPFYFEIKDAVTQFVAAFNDIVIKRHDKYREQRSRVKVRYTYAPKQRVIHDLTNKAKHITLPVVAVSTAGVSRDEGRVFNKLYGAYMSEQERHPSAPKTIKAGTTYNIPQPVPINISINMSILARYQTDIEQILSNFIPYNDPYIMISWKLPKEFFPKEQEIRSEVLWSGDISMDYPDNLSSNDPYRLSCDTSFTIKTWLFKQASSQPISNIYKITTNTTPVINFNDLDGDTQSSTVETFGPPLTAAPYITHVGDYGTILGYNFNSTTSVYLSSTTLNQLSGEKVDIHGDRQISTHFPAFTGVPVEYDIVSDNIINIDISSIDDSEPVDVMIANAGGYGSIALSDHHQELI